jgi:hypothetical protein
MASNVENHPPAASDADPSVGPEEDEPVPDSPDPHPDFPDDFDDDVAGRESEEAIPEQGRSGR